MNETAAELAPALTLTFQASFQQSALQMTGRKLLSHQSSRKVTEANQLIIDRYL
jgi:hypothetical protein